MFLIKSSRNHAPTEQIAADIAQLTEERRQHKVATESSSAPRKLLLKRTARSAKARRQMQESKWKDSTPHPLKVSAPGKGSLADCLTSCDLDTA